MEKHRKFSPEFKREAVELVRSSGPSASQIAGDIGVNQNVLSR